jgi:type VI protein secretion system component VasK
MTRFLILFIVLLAISLALMAGMMAQYGYSLFAPEMRNMLLVAFLVAGYVSFRITRILDRRRQKLDDHPQPGGAGRSKLAGLFSGKSAAQQAREARVAARRRKLVEAGKLKEEDTPAGPEAEPDEAAPTRVSQSAPIGDRMAARAERVRRAKEAGKLD